MTVLVHGQDIRLANGSVVKGTVLQKTDTGLVIQTPSGERTIEWAQLSAGTRYRLQPLYRANYEAVLLGLPVSAWTNAPAADEESATPEASPAASAAPVTEAAPAPVGSQSLDFASQAAFEVADWLRSGAIPGLQLRAADEALYKAFQYGPGAGEVVYLVLDTKGGGDVRDVLFVYSPGNAALSRTVKYSGFKKSVGDNRIVSFKRVPLNTRFGIIDTRIELEASSSLTTWLSVTFYVDLTANDTKARIILSGEMPDYLVGGGLIGAAGVLDLPVLWLALDMSTGAPAVIGNLNMSGLHVVPKDGLDNKINLEISDSKGAVIQRETVKLDESTLNAPNQFLLPIKKATPGELYTVKGSINLAPFFGSVTREVKVVVPK
jgi:hypothetical protein